MGNYLATYFGRMYISHEDSDWDIARHSTRRNISEKNSNMKPEPGNDGGEHFMDRSSSVDNHEEGRSSSTSRMGEQGQFEPASSHSKQNTASDADSADLSTSESIQKQCKRSLEDNVCHMNQAKVLRLLSHPARSCALAEQTSNKFTEYHTEARCLSMSQSNTSKQIEKLASVSRHERNLYSDEQCQGDNFTSSDNDDLIEHSQQDSPIQRLPSVLLIHIFSYLPLADLLHRASLVCKYWYDLSHDPDLWIEVNLRGQMKLTDQILQRVISYNKGVVSVDISDARTVTDNGVEVLAKQCPGLLCLKMMRCVQLKEVAFRAVGEYCCNLVHLYLDCCFCLSDEALAAISAGCPKLRVLHINQCGILSNTGIEAVGKGCPELEDLSMDQCKQVGDPGLLAIIHGCTKLRRLSAMSCVFSSEGIMELIKLRHLQRLELHDVLGVTDDCIIKVVEHCKQLDTLNLSLCTRITDRSVDYIARHASCLRALYLASCDLTDKALISLGLNSRTLETVDVGWCSNISDLGANEISARCSTLRNLGLTRCDKVTIPTMDYLVEQYPHIHYSTFWLDCRRLMSRAQKIGIIHTPHHPQ